MAKSKQTPRSDKTKGSKEPGKKQITMKKQKPTTVSKKVGTRSLPARGIAQMPVTSLDISTLNKYLELNLSTEILKKLEEEKISNLKTIIQKGGLGSLIKQFAEDKKTINALENLEALARLSPLSSDLQTIDKLNKKGCSITSIGSHTREEFIEKIKKIIDEDEASEIHAKAKAQRVMDFETPIVVKPNKKRWIEGRVVYEDGTPAKNFTLRLYRIDIQGDDEKLGQCTSLASGHYTLSYAVEEHELILEIRAVHKITKKEVTLSSPLVDLPERAVVNLVMPASAEKPKSEYEYMTELLQPHVGNMEKLENIREDTERRDISSLNRATGLDARQIVLASQSARLSKDTKLSQEELYGCLRAGLPSDKELLAQVDPEFAENALKKAQDAGIVALTADAISTFRKNFEEFARKVLMSSREEVLVNLIEKDDAYKILIAASGAIQKLKKGVIKGFRLGATHISDFFTTNEEDKNDKILLKEEELESLKTLQRIYQITPCHEAMPVLKNLGVHSARDVVSMPEEVFARCFENIYIETFTDEKPPAELAALIHRKATQITKKLTDNDS